MNTFENIYGVLNHLFGLLRNGWATAPLVLERPTPFSVLRFPFSVLRFPFSVLRCPFSVFRSPFSVFSFLFSVLRCPFS